MEIRKASAEEMMELWGYRNWEEATPTARFFLENISSGNAELWTIDHNGGLIGELYAFKDLADKDFADGETKAYLCAFRIKEGYRRKGLGSRLLETVLSHLKDSGFRVAMIGVDETERDNIKLYRRFGFATKIKDCFEDPCAVDDEMKPKACSCFWLLSKRLTADDRE